MLEVIVVRVVVAGIAIVLGLGAASGCVLGGGPVLSLRHGHPALGWEAGGGPIFLRADVGRSTPLSGPETGKRIKYAGLTAQVPSAAFGSVSATSEPAARHPLPEFLWTGLSLGGAWGEDGGGLYGNAFASFVHVPEHTCSNDVPALAATVALGARWLGTAGEVYVAPRADLFWGICFR